MLAFGLFFFCLICALEQRKTYLRSRASVLKFQLPTLFSDYSRPEQKARTFSALKQTISRSFFIKLEVEQAAMSVCYSRNWLNYKFINAPQVFFANKHSS